ncbi:MAG TPA: HAD family hydrolase [Dehalococcoidia bacterium]|jgi:HAD superfamily hydrolase (TIGR01549 family)|nr:HAD family hydrolase [Dehalococcoidia bacterium]
MVKGIIFDFDETLVNSLETYWQVFRCGAQRLNLPAPKREELAALLSEGKGLLEILSQIYPALDKEAILNCAGKMREAFTDVVIEFPITIKPEVKGVLSSLKMKGVKIGLVTGRICSSEQMWAELRGLSIAQFFDAVVTGGDQPRKPAPDGIITCLEKLNLAAEDSIIVGDAKSDLIAGKKAGVRVIVLSSEGAVGETFAPEQPDMVIDNLSQLVRFLEQEVAAE